MIQDILRKLNPSAIGVALFTLFVPIYLFVTEVISVKIVAITCALSTGIYIGFGVSVRSMTTFWLGLRVAAFNTSVALFRLLLNRLASMLGLAAHIVRDTPHCNGGIGAPVPKKVSPMRYVL
ncbi:hypothetical protein [Sulfitobacter sp. MF3-043]|uniref:hypothetical protein n=1 Tax=Sulfitobacter sediminivivens TaxID=3252902 RepID=UPI0036D781EB